jgi:hypothetical protein
MRLAFNHIFFNALLRRITEASGTAQETSESVCWGNRIVVFAHTIPPQDTSDKKKASPVSVPN